MIKSFQQQEQMLVIELYIEKDVAGGSTFHSANSVRSCVNSLSNNELEPPRNVSNLDDDEDEDDDYYFVSNSYVEEFLDEDDSVDGISDTDDKVTHMIEPVTIVQLRKGVEGIQNPFWNYVLHYNNINWSHPNEEDNYGLEMPSSFNVGQELYVGMIREDPSIKVSLIQERINNEFSYKVSYEKAWMAEQKAIAIEYDDWEESYAKLSSWPKHMPNNSLGSYFQILHDDFIVGNKVSREHRKEAFNYCKPMIQVHTLLLLVVM
ncbi:hypothetical protein GmHk_04G009964 [Glycine max]|nr:hypothetical protein GmHk_04G009964 [Glycine max]